MFTFNTHILDRGKDRLTLITVWELCRKTLELIKSDTRIWSGCVFINYSWVFPFLLKVCLSVQQHIWGTPINPEIKPLFRSFFFCLYLMESFARGRKQSRAGGGHTPHEVKKRTRSCDEDHSLHISNMLMLWKSISNMLMFYNALGLSLMFQFIQPIPNMPILCNSLSR